MPKLKHFSDSGLCYHVITATRGRAPLFSTPANADVLRSALQFIRQERALLLAYAIMPDHPHAVIVPKPPFTISKVMQTVKGYSARQVNAVSGRSGAIWQEGFYDRVIRDESQLNQTIRYILWNPVAAGFAERPEDYRFSSANDRSDDLGEFLA